MKMYVLLKNAAIMSVSLFIFNFLLFILFLPQHLAIMSARTLASPSMRVALGTASSLAALSPWCVRTVLLKPKELRPSPVS